MIWSISYATPFLHHRPLLNRQPCFSHIARTDLDFVHQVHLRRQYKERNPRFDRFQFNLYKKFECVRQLSFFRVLASFSLNLAGDVAIPGRTGC